MNPTLIDQLKLAIQVEEGSVPLSDVETRARNADIGPHKWIEVTIPPSDWWYRSWEFRRKPKPLECWANFYSDGSLIGFTSESEAKSQAHKERMSHLPPTKIAVHMKEVT